MVRRLQLLYICFEQPDMLGSTSDTYPIRAGSWMISDQALWARGTVPCEATVEKFEVL